MHLTEFFMGKRCFSLPKITKQHKNAQLLKWLMLYQNNAEEMEVNLKGHWKEGT